MSHRKNGVVGGGTTSGREVGGGLGVGLPIGVLVGSGEVWTPAVGLGRAATGGVGPVVQAASRARQNAQERSLDTLMTT